MRYLSHRLIFIEGRRLSDIIRTFDLAILEVQEIERDLPSSARDTMRKAQIQGLEKSLLVKVSQLLDHVNDEAQKYVPKPMNTDTSRSQRRENLTDRAVLEGGAAICLLKQLILKFTERH